MPSRSPTVASPLLLPGQPPLPLRLHGARQGRGPTPVVLHLHGGAFIAGDLDSGECFAQLLAKAGAVVVSVAYPLAPAHPFPQAAEAAYAALAWLWGQRGTLGGTRAPLFVAGEEAGGNLAAAVSAMARDRAEVELAGQILVAPMLDPCTAMPSQREAAGDEVHCRWSLGWSQYLRCPMDAEHPYAVPALAQRLAGLPPALVLAGEDDPMRDEAVAYAKRLEQAGIAVQTFLIPATGWPESLEAPPHPCPCEATVVEHLRAFLNAPEPAS
ncbi:MAG: alpha/beta hydrolase [Comamonadaceae bacterium]|nr:MAG: alpha/beta hydrolase [Comamonadaceae bacterium]